MPRRASLPGAEELFRSTAETPGSEAGGGMHTMAEYLPETSPVAGQERPRHGEKVTFYCTGSDLNRLERVRLSLRTEHGLACDRSRMVRAALAEVLEDFEQNQAHSALVKRLST